VNGFERGAGPGPGAVEAQAAGAYPRGDVQEMVNDEAGEHSDELDLC
jgi:hypothetical protein